MIRQEKPELSESVGIYCTAHAIRRYRERVSRVPLTPEQARREIEEAMRRPLFARELRPSGLVLWGCRNAHGFCFTAATAPLDRHPGWLVVQTVGPWWHWHEVKRLWREERHRLEQR